MAVEPLVKYAQGQRLTHAVVHSIDNILFVVVIKYMARTNDGKIDHVKAYNISLSYCTVHIVRWNIVYFFLMASRTFNSL